METQHTARGEDSRAWVDKIECPRQRAVARRIPAIMALFGLRASDIREEPAGPENEAVIGRALRMPAIGSIARLLRELGLPWSACSKARTQIRDLDAQCHATMFIAWRRAVTFGEQGGYVGTAYEAALGQIRELVERDVSDARRAVEEEASAETKKRARNARRRERRARESHQATESAAARKASKSSTGASSRRSGRAGVGPASTSGPGGGSHLLPFEKVDLSPPPGREKPARSARSSRRARS
jgi:hypothetical protein